MTEEIGWTLALSETRRQVLSRVGPLYDGSALKHLFVDLAPINEVKYVLIQISNSYTMRCPPVRRDNPRALNMV